VKLKLKSKLHNLIEIEIHNYLDIRNITWVLTAVHLQCENPKFHKVQYRHYSGEAENVYISVRQIYSW